MRILPPVQEDDKMLAGLSYPFWFAVAPLVLWSARRQEPFVQYHARQSIGLGIASILATALVGVVLWLCFLILPPGTITGLVGVALFGAACFALFFLFCAFFFVSYRASAGEFFQLPWLGERCLQQVILDLDLDPESLTDEAPAPAPVTVAAPPPAPRELRPAPPPASISPPNGTPRPVPEPRPLQQEIHKSWEGSAIKGDVLKRWLSETEE